MGRVWINVHNPKDRVIVEKEGKNNVPIINNVLSIWKMKEWKSDINISDDS